MKNDVYIIDGLRTGIGSPYRGLKHWNAAKLGGFVVKALVKRTGVKKGAVSEVIMGNTVGAGTGQNPARQAAVHGGLSFETPAYTVNSVCGAGMQSIICGIQSIRGGSNGIVIAGGLESATHNPNLVFDLEEKGHVQNRDVDALNYDGLWCMMTNRHMGELAEVVAKEHKISRDEQDRYALDSYQKAFEAKSTGKFKDEITVVKSSGVRRYDSDDRVRANINLEKFIDLPPAFMKSGTVTAGNASVPCDGASGVLLASEKSLPLIRKKPRARIVSYAVVSTDPKYTFTCGEKAIKSALSKAGLKLKDIDAFEISEAFAVQAIYTRKRLRIPADRMNVWGGDLALGHPLGSAGSRIVVTLLNVLQDTKGRLGLANICLGGGGSLALIVEQVKK